MIAIYENMESGKVEKFVSTKEQLMKYCSEKKAKEILEAYESGRLHGVHFTKTGQIRAQYNW